MEEWKEYRLGDLINISSGFAYKGEFIGNGENYLLGMGCVSFRDTFLVSGIRPYSGDAPDRYLAYSGDIVLATRQQSDNLPILGMPAIIPKKYDGHKMIVGANLYKVQNNSDFSNEYIYWLMKSPAYVHHIKSCQTGTTVRMITKANIEDFTFLAPKKETRDKIAQFFWNIENKIELNRRINENLEQQAQALFKSWFVDFEPFKDGKFVDSELGMIPEGWKVGTIGDYSKIRSGFAFKSSWWTDKGVKIVKIKNISSYGNLDMNDCSYVSKENTLKAKEFSLKPGDLLIAMTGATIGKFCIVPILKEEMYVNQRVGKFFLGEKPISKVPFIYGLLKSENIISQIINKGQGSAQPNISANDIETISIILPTEDIISKYNELVSPYFSLLIKNLNECDYLAQLRDILLPKLMSGELQI